MSSIIFIFLITIFSLCSALVIKKAATHIASFFDDAA